LLRQHTTHVSGIHTVETIPVYFFCVITNHTAHNKRSTMMISGSMFLRSATRSQGLRTVSSLTRTSLRSVPAALAARASAAAAPASFQQKAFFSDDSHSDFAAKRKEVTGESEALKMIQEHVDNNHIMLYMKGNPSQPMCGFSAKVVQALQAEGADFSSVNVLDYPDIREGIKKFSEWPTIPQLYVKGEFLGGCDIVLAMHESGELAEVLKEEEK
jgi:monothiol glutaredoxin